MTELRVGTHLIVIAGDILFMQPAGDLLEVDMEKYIALAEQITAAHGHVFLLDDFSRFGTIGAAARKRVAGWLSKGSCWGAAIYGASLSARTLTTLITGAMRVLGNQTLPVSFVKTDAEGRQWIATQRQERLAK